MHARLVLAAAVTSLSLLGAPARAQLVTPPPPGVAGSLFVPVELPGPEGSRLEMFFGARMRDVDDDAVWRPVCKSPCRIELPAGARLRVNGSFATSPAFLLPRRGVSLAVDPARWWGRGVGMAIVVPGALATALGAWAVGSGGVGGGESRANWGWYELPETQFLVGSAMVLGAGLYLAISQWETRVQLRELRGTEPRGAALQSGVRMSLGAGGVGMAW